MTPSPERVLAWLKKRRVAVLKGGWSRERPISLKTGAAVEASLRQLGIKPVSIDVRPNIASRLAAVKPQFCFIALHGAFGEDGGIQALLDTLRIPYNGSGPLGSALAMDKDLSKRLFSQAGIPTAPWVTLGRVDLKRPGGVDGARALLKKGAVFVKPVDQGSALGASKAATPRALIAALKACFRYSDRAMVERFIAGRELTVGILGGTALPVVEILPVHAFYDFHSKYAKGGSRHVVPARISSAAAKHASKISLDAFRALGCEVYGRVDVLMKSDRDMYVLEVNTIPGMTATSLLPDAASAIGMNFGALVLNIIGLSLEACGISVGRPTLRVR